MGQRKASKKVDAENASIMRDACLARLVVARSHLASAIAAIDESVEHFIDPSDDEKGKKRAALLEAADDLIGESATALQVAQGAYEDVDPTESEEYDEELEDDEDEDEEDDEEDDEAEDE